MNPGAAAPDPPADRSVELLTVFRAAPAHRPVSWALPLRIALVAWLPATLARYAVGYLAYYSRHHSLPGVTRLFSGWDSGHFMRIAEHGYFGPGAGRVDIAFFPGYPLAVRGLAALIGLGRVTTGGLYFSAWLIPTVASLVATGFIARIALDRWGHRTAWIAALAFMFGPYAVFLTASYSESLYVALGAAAWWCSTRNRWLLAGIACACASLVRVNGAFLAVALLVMFWCSVARGDQRFRVTAVLSVLIGFGGAAAYLMFLYAKTGSLMSWSKAQEIGWQRHFASPVTGLLNTVRRGLHVQSWSQRVQNLTDVVAALSGTAAVVVMAWRRFWPEVTYAALTLASLTFATKYWSLSRNTLTLFPVLILLAAWLARRNRIVAVSVLVVSGVWMLFLAALFPLRYWVG